ncbi:alkylated DNA repair protein ALKBH8 homolog isoform X3 [Ziziphus jujuba]|uniref:Alkylated DNA repair protein ALKBH8 homolog isoform X3 n=1 Tax=Ziziphus jujuba TaxID=326968 RepID=A0ABM4ACR5_ZIZJJ|nr:alkylated DNA repair protein ALKBH8 homolog isoform X3 [Ziziphus jujuba]
MGLPRFGRPKGVGGSQLSPNLYVANCGPAVGISYETIALVFGAFGEVSGVHAADESGARVVVSFAEEGSARAAMEALDGRPCQDLGGRSLHIRYSVLRPPTSLGPVNDSVSVSLMASELNIPGLYLLHDFVSCKEEKDLLAAVDERPWKNLSKRRVQHYGYEFCYETRNVDSKQHLGPCIMEFRRYVERGWLPKASSSTDMNIENPERNSNFLRRAVYLPPRSMLLLSGEARYAWHHYIPHHKIDMVKDRMIRRGSRRVSFTFREVRTTPCQCDFPQYCDSQR